MNNAINQGSAVNFLDKTQIVPIGSYAYMRPRYLYSSAWLEHIPFAFWLAEALRPSLFVELGTHWGASYFSFCQALDKLDLGSQAFAVDRWTGDEHTGAYGPEVFRDVKSYNDNNFGTFSTLLKQDFNEASTYFLDGSIDLLHIDGFHTYEAVKSDFETWLPKISDAGVVLLHDTNVRERNFGVFRLFQELRQTYPVFEFFHGHGLGVIGVGTQLPERIRGLFDAERNSGDRRDIQRLFASLGKACFDSHKNKDVQSKVAREAESDQETLTRQLLDESCVAEQKIRELETKASELASLLEKQEGVVASLQNELSEVGRKSTEVEHALVRSRGEIEDRDKFLQNLEAERSETEWKLGGRLAVDREVSIHALEQKLETVNSQLSISRQQLQDHLGRQSNAIELEQTLRAEAEELANRLSEVTSALIQRQHETEQNAVEILDLRRRLESAADTNSQGEKIADALRSHINLLLEDVKNFHAAQLDFNRREEAQSKIIDELNAATARMNLELQDGRAALEKALAELKHERQNRLALESDKVGSELRAQERYKEVSTLTQMLATKESQLALLPHFRTEAGRELGRAILKVLELTTLWRLLPKKLQLSRKVVLLKNSGLFDAEWYRNHYSDIYDAGVDPVRHYVEYGASEGRYPNASLVVLESRLLGEG